jgi:hypothetical protein
MKSSCQLHRPLLVDAVGAAAVAAIGQDDADVVGVECEQLNLLSSALLGLDSTSTGPWVQVMAARVWSNLWTTKAAKCNGLRY